MTDHFALLDEPRRPWLDVEALKAKFHARSAAAHPDRLHSTSEEAKQAATTQYAALNAAYQCLREPKDRLQHLLDLERGGRPIGIEQVPAETMTLFLQIGQQCRDADIFLAERAQVTAPMLKVQMFQRALDWTDRLQQQLTELNERRNALEATLQSMNTEWDAAPKPGDPSRASTLPLDRLEQTYRALSFLSRWITQLQERIVRLSL